MKRGRRSCGPYASLQPLRTYISILNNPSPPPSSSTTVKSTAGKAPAFSPAALPWVGGSLAGCVVGRWGSFRVSHAFLAVP